MGAAGKNRELGGRRRERWVWAVGCSPWCFWEQQHVWILLLFSIYNCSHSEQEQKQRRALAPSLPLAEPPAQPDSSLGSLAPCAAQGLSLTHRAPHGRLVGASPAPEHWAKAAGLECDCPAPREGVCRLDQRPQEGDLTRGLWQNTVSKCSWSPAQAVKHRLPSAGVSLSVQQHRGWE